jgi:hypothetical protein
MAKSGTPIRLLREDGEFIELNATKLVMSTERRFGPKSFPFSGNNRFVLDLNLNKAVIMIQGFFSDDEVAVEGGKASATIEFGYGLGAEICASNGCFTPKYSVCTITNLEKLFATTSNAQLSLNDVDGTARNILLKLEDMESENPSTTYNSSTKTLTVVNTIDAATLATQIKNAINISYSSYFSVEQVDGEDANYQTLTNSKLKITHKSTGKGGNNSALPSISTSDYYQVVWKPLIHKFAGGTNNVRKSAGDKAQDIYSILNNSSRKSFRAAGRRMKGISIFYDKETMGELSPSGSDYIVGIQIPFNSLIDPVGDVYVAKNFFMPTGWIDKDEKTSENALVAGTSFNELNNWTGISGGIKNMEISYDAGEAVYNFDLVFLPADVMI